jgi:hypothetical protein
MDMDNPPPRPGSPSGNPQKGGRKLKVPITDRIAALREELSRAEADAREAHKAKAAVVGAVVIEAMKESPELAAQVVAILKAKVKGARDKATIADLLL